MKEKAKDLRFNITEDMNNMMIELLIINQMLEESLKPNTSFNDKERYLLYKHFEKLKDEFSKEFKNKNVEQLKKYNELMDK